MFLSRFAATANHGRLPRPVYARPGCTAPDGPRTRTPPIPDSFWLNDWNSESLPAGLPRVAPRSRDLREPSQRLFERLGSNTNDNHFILLQDCVNSVKGKIEVFRSPMDLTRFNRYVRQAAGGDRLAMMSFMAPLRDVWFTSFALLFPCECYK